MSTPQDSPRRRKQKARRTKQLDEWRLKKATAALGSGAAAKPAAAAAKKADKAPKPSAEKKPAEKKTAK